MTPVEGAGDASGITSETRDASDAAGRDGSRPTADGTSADPSAGRAPVEADAIGLLAGLSVADRSVEAAVAAVADRDPGRDRRRIRAAFDRVAQDGVVCRGGLVEALGHGSKVVATAETRTELAERAVSDARETLASAGATPTLAARLDVFADRSAALLDRADGLGDDVSALADRTTDGDPIAPLALALDALLTDANRVTQAADELQLELESFEHWVANATHRAQRLDADVEDVEAYCSDLEELLDALVAPGKEVPTTPALCPDADEAARRSAWPDADRTAWLAARLRLDVAHLLAADLEADIAAARRLGTALDEGPSLDALDRRHRALRERVDAAARAVTDLARPQWVETFADARRSADARLADREPPVDWAAVEDECATVRATLRGSLRTDAA